MGRAVRLLVAAALALALGGWSTPQELETAPVSRAALEGDGHGHRVAAWITDTAVRVAVAEKGRDFGPARTLASAGSPFSGMQLAVGPRGDALVVWSAFTSGYVPTTGEGCCIIMRAALLSRAGRVTGPVTLTRTGSTPPFNSFSSVLGAGSHGRFGVAWSSPDADSQFVRLASIRHGFGALERVPGGGVHGLLSFDRGHVRLLSSLYSAVPEEGGRLEEVSRDEAGRWSGPRSLLQPIYGGVFGADARGRQVGIVSAGGPTEVVLRAPPGPLVRSAVVPWGNPEERIAPSLAVAWSGAAVMAWTRHGGSESDGEVRVRMRRPGRRFGPVTLVYQLPPGAGMRDAAVAPDGSVAIGIDEYPSPVQPVVLVRPGGGVRSAEGVRTGLSLYVSDVLADSHGAAALLEHRSSQAGLWASRTP